MIDPGPARPPEFDDLTDSQARRIDQVCDGFETVWKSGRRPRIEAFLEGCHGTARAVLLHELVLLEADYRKRSGEAPEPADYRRRFSEFEDAWLEAHPRAQSVPGRAVGRSRRHEIGGSAGTSSAEDRSGAAAGQVPAPGEGRRGGVRRRLACPRRPVEPDGRPQDPPGPPDRDPRGCRAVLHRGQGRRPAQASRDRHLARGDGARRPADPGPRFRHGDLPPRPLRNAEAHAAGRGRAGGQGRRCPGLCPFDGGDPSRRQAGQHHARPVLAGAEDAASESGSGWPGEPRIVDFGLAFLEQERCRATPAGTGSSALRPT